MKSTLHELFDEFAATGHPSLFKNEEPYLTTHPRLVCQHPEKLPIAETQVRNFKTESWTKVPTPMPFEKFSIEFNAQGHTKVYAFFALEGAKVTITAYTEVNALSAETGKKATTFFPMQAEIKGTTDFRWKVCRLEDANEYLKLLEGSNYNFSPEHLKEFKDFLVQTLINTVAYSLSFIQVMNSRNTELVENKAGKVSIMKARKKRKTVPQDFLTVRVKPGKVKKSSTSNGGSHASPVAHARRSHLRHYKTGLSVVIPPALVNAHKGVTTQQEYVF